MPWYGWVIVLSLAAVGVKPIRRALMQRITKRISGGPAKRSRTASRRPPSKTAVRTARRPPSTPWKPVAPVVQPGVRPPRPLSVLRPQRCSAACRQSRKPASTCDCACGGRDHGRYVPGTAAAIRATRYTPAQKTAQRRAVEAAATERWRRKQKKLQDQVVVTRGGKSAPKGGGSSS